MPETSVILTNYGNDQILQAIANDTNVYVAAMVYGDGGGYSVTAFASHTSLVYQFGEIYNITNIFDESD